MGWTGSIMARELTKAGLNVVGLERGENRVPSEDFTLPGIRDELKYRLRFQLMLDNSVETLTMRQHTRRDRGADAALGRVPARRRRRRRRHALERRYLAHHSLRARLRSHLTERYGRNAIPADLTIQDFGVTYDELEPHFDRFEKLCGTSGKAGNLRGVMQEGGNPFEGPRRTNIPTSRLIMSQAGLIFTEAAKKVGYHPFPTPSSNNSAAYTNPEGMTLGAAASIAATANISAASPIRRRARTSASCPACGRTVVSSCGPMPM